LIRLGSSTLPIAIAEPRSTVPAKSAASGPLERTRKPTIRRVIAVSSARSMPSRRASGGASGAIRPKQSTGRAVRIPAAVAESCSSDWICESSGATPTTAGRRFAAISTIATPIHHAGAGTDRAGRMEALTLTTALRCVP
jgi:hypothetical protein